METFEIPIKKLGEEALLDRDFKRADFDECWDMHGNKIYDDSHPCREFEMRHVKIANHKRIAYDDLDWDCWEVVIDGKSCGGCRGFKARETVCRVDEPWGAGRLKGRISMAVAVDHDIALPSDWGALNDCLGFVGTIENELQFNDIQIQIARERAEGCCIEWKGGRIDLDESGAPSRWPLGRLDQSQCAFSELRAVRAGREVDDSHDWRHDD